MKSRKIPWLSLSPHQNRSRKLKVLPNFIKQENIFLFDQSQINSHLYFHNSTNFLWHCIVWSFIKLIIISWNVLKCSMAEKFTFICYCGAAVWCLGVPVSCVFWGGSSTPLRWVLLWDIWYIYDRVFNWAIYFHFKKGGLGEA